MRLATLGVALSLMIGTASAQQGSVEYYAGHFPTEYVGGRSFFDAVRAAIFPVVGEARWLRLAEYGTSTPIEVADDREFGRVLVSWQCHREQCANEATIVVTIGGQLVAICFADGTRAEWIGPGWRAPARELECGWEPAEVLARLRAARARQ